MSNHSKEKLPLSEEQKHEKINSNIRIRDYGGSGPCSAIWFEHIDGVANDAEMRAAVKKRLQICQKLNGCSACKLLGVNAGAYHWYTLLYPPEGDSCVLTYQLVVPAKGKTEEDDDWIRNNLHESPLE